MSFVSSKGNILCGLTNTELYKIFAILNRAIKGLHCIFGCELDSHYTHCLNEVERGYTGFSLGVHPSVHRYVCPSVDKNISVPSVSSTILAGSIWYLHILSSNFRRCVMSIVYFKIWSFGKFFKLVTLTCHLPMPSHYLNQWLLFIRCTLTSKHLCNLMETQTFPVRKMHFMISPKCAPFWGALTLLTLWGLDKMTQFCRCHFPMDFLEW